MLRTIRNFFVLGTIITIFGFLAEASDTIVADPNDQSAMQQTKDLLKDPKQRQEVYKKDSKAKEADSQLNMVTGGNEGDNQAIYEMSADIFDNFKGMTPEQMQEVLAKAMRDPAGFAKSLTPAQQAKIKAISGKIEERKSAKP